MQLLLLLIVCLAFVPLPGGTPPFGALASSLTIWCGVGALFLSAWCWSQYLSRRLVAQPARRQLDLRLYSRVRLAHSLANILWYLLSLFGLGWGAVVRTEWHLDNLVLIDELLVLAPFLVGQCLEWLAFYGTEKTLHLTSSRSDDQPFLGRFEYLAYHVRFYLGLVLAPILIFTAGQEALLLWMPWAEDQLWFVLVSAGLLSVVILILAPVLLKVLWQARPLPAGPLRQRLEAVARRLRFRYTDILLWRTRSGLANALVTGVLPFPRYVLLSDGLVEGLTPKQIEAVFGHEIGHVKHHHMLLYLTFMVLSLLLLTLSAQLALPPLPEEEPDYLVWLADWWQQREVWLPSLGGLVFLGGYIWLVFGLLSRRCERQADVFGCKTVSCDNPHCPGPMCAGAADASDRLGLCPAGVRTFIEALERVAELNGIRKEKPSWRHASIARRVAFLEALLKEPGLESRFQKRLLWTKIALVATLATAVIVLAVLCY
jgi:STE24 endopeptidase